jgi:splicing factor U2AF 65 kDa subunit
MSHRAVPLHLRTRRLNLFDIGNELADAMDCLEELLDSKINITQNTDKVLYTPLVIPALRRREFTEADMENSRIILCYTRREPSALYGYLDRYIGSYKFKVVNDAIAVRLMSPRDAAYCISLCNEDFVFLRPRDYVETREESLGGNKYSPDVPCTEDKIILGPLDVDPVALRDVLDSIAPLSGFRQCQDKRFFTFSFQAPEVADLFLTTTSHITITDYSTDLVSRRACDGCCLLRLNRHFLDRTPRRMSGAIVLSMEATRIVVLLNVVGPWDENVHEIRAFVMSEATRMGRVRNVVIPRGEGAARVPGSNKVFIECEDIESATNVYLALGGLLFEGRVVATGFYPELNYSIGEYE